ncbi:MAG: FAD-dependent oxidoreductase [Novosphingobium sp.]|nr:FAD-dependent oxidoreductase [Novosphingobium sp.]
MAAGQNGKHSKYPHTFTPIQLGPVEVRNRFYFSPHGTALTVGTMPSEDFCHYNVERVKDEGCGLVISSLVVHDRGVIYQPSPYPEENLPSFKAMADAVHEAGGKIFGQLWYWWGTLGQWQPLSPPAPSLAASAVQTAWYEKALSTHEMNHEEIAQMIAAFRQSAAHLREAGWDGIELHAAHAAVLEHFVSPFFNRREDEYGGSLDNRLRVLIEALEATREGAGPDMAIGMRFNCDEMLPGGYDQTEAAEILKRICDAGLLDFVDLDVAIEPNQLGIGMPPVFVEPHMYAPYVGALRGAAGDVPVLSVLGRLTSVEDGEAALASGLCDMVGATRALIAEPELVKNAFRGREDRSRICIACNYCCAAGNEGAQGCAINPAAYRERLWGVEHFEPAATPGKVVIVGGGPGGLEAARVAALKGHEVVLIEARERLGGALALWADLPDRDFYHHSIDWWQRELDLLGVTVRSGEEASAASVLAEAPDAVIIATGARYSQGGRSAFLDIDIPGFDQDWVYRPDEILLGNEPPVGRITLLDGEGLHTSAGIAERLAAKGGQLDYMTPGFAPVSLRLYDSLEATFIITRLRDMKNISFTPATWIRQIGDHQLTVYDTFTEEERVITDVDALVLSTGRLPMDSLARQLEGKVTQLFTIGDALAARPFAAAAYEGQKFARLIGEEGAPATFSEAYFRPKEPELFPTPA